MSEDLARLGRYVKERREDLELSQMAVWKLRNGPSSTKLGQIEEGLPPAPRKSTRAKLERALEWQEGSVARILAGAEPVPESRLEGSTDLRPDLKHAWSKVQRAEFEFHQWAELYMQLLPIEFRYSAARGINPSQARSELVQVLRMAQQAADGGGRPWTPPWLWDGPGEPWNDSFYYTDEGMELVRRRKTEFNFEPEDEDPVVIRVAHPNYPTSDMSDPDETVPAAAEEGDVEPDEVEFNT